MQELKSVASLLENINSSNVAES